MNIRFAADFFNLFNHPNDVNPDQLTGLVNLGRQWNDPRTIQLSLRFDFLVPVLRPACGLWRGAEKSWSCSALEIEGWSSILFL